MANITLGALRDLWKTVSDWVSGTSADIPKVSDDDVKTALDILNSKDFATQTTLATMLNKIIAAPATEAKQDALKAVVDTLGTEATLAAIKSWIDGTDDVSAPKVTLSGTNASDSGLAANRPDATTVREGFVYWSVDTDVMEYSDGTSWVVM